MALPNATTAATTTTVPIGCNPNGIWYKQTYRGPKTSRAETATLLWDVLIPHNDVVELSRLALNGPKGIVPPMDERYVYCDRNNRSFHAMDGTKVSGSQGPLSFVPSGLEPRRKLSQSEIVDVQQAVHGKHKADTGNTTNRASSIYDGLESVDYDGSDTGEREELPPAREPPAETPTTTIKKISSNHPPDTQPGGTWYKHVYKGPKTSRASCLACFFYGCNEGYLASQIAFDDRTVYHNLKGDGKFYTEQGLQLDVTNTPGSGILHPMESPATDHSKEESKLQPGAAMRLSRFDPSISEEARKFLPAFQYIKKRRYGQRRQYDHESTVNHHHPPGTNPGGSWYKQTLQGQKSRYVYREDLNHMKFFDKEGKQVNPGEGIFQPPL